MQIGTEFLFDISILERGQAIKLNYWLEIQVINPSKLERFIAGTKDSGILRELPTGVDCVPSHCDLT